MPDPTDPTSRNSASRDAAQRNGDALPQLFASVRAKSLPWNDDDAALWNLLGKSEPVTPGPFFVQETLRRALRMRSAGQVPDAFPNGADGGMFRLVWGRGMLLSGACVALAALLALISMDLREGAQPDGLERLAAAPSEMSLQPAVRPLVESGSGASVPETSGAVDAEIIAQLDGLLAMEENLVWTGNGELF